MSGLFILKLIVFFFSVKERYSGKNMKYYDELPQMAILNWVRHS